MTDVAPETKTGQISAWHWGEYCTDEVTVSEVVSNLRRHLTGMRAVCSSWDSGMLKPAGPEWSGWFTECGHAVSPPIDDHLATSWPQSGCGYDEWYFFGVVPTLSTVHSICNWTGLSIGECGPLARVPNGFDLAAQLERLNPELVVGDGDRVFVIAKDKQVVSEFLESCRCRRTTR